MTNIANRNFEIIHNMYISDVLIYSFGIEWNMRIVSEIFGDAFSLQILDKRLGGKLPINSLNKRVKLLKTKGILIIDKEGNLKLTESGLQLHNAIEPLRVCLARLEEKLPEQMAA